VQGFETSDAHEELIQTLLKCEFRFQEFLISPTSIGIPNSRLRYYLIAKHQSLPWYFDSSTEQPIQTSIPPAVPDRLQVLMKSQARTWESFRKSQSNSSKYGTIPSDYPRCVGDILEPLDEAITYNLPTQKAKKYWNAVDIVNPSSTQSCCFTKAYYHYLTGTGSILDYTFSFNELLGPEAAFRDCKVEERHLRYFTPREVARLMCYPEKFQFPPHHTPKQRYKALGNSVNVFVVATLMSLLFENDCPPLS
jgi:tRNA (cytosine38-C5)-methyltransferase